MSIMFISLPNSMIDHLLESSHRDDSNTLPNIGFGEETTQIESTETYFKYLILSSKTNKRRNNILFWT